MERFYPFEHKNEESRGANDAAGEQKPAGKGRRDGNAQASKVIHSGNFKEKPAARSYENDRKPRYGEERNGHFDRDGRRHEGRYEGRRDDRYEGHRDDRRENRPFRYEREGGNVLCPGETYSLKVDETTGYGAFLSAGDGSRVLLPFSEMPEERPSVGDTVEVTIYEDKGGRLTATMHSPILKEGETGVLTVAAVTKIGVFVDNGMPKQTLVPFRELLHTPNQGDRILVYIYKDKSGREAATMRVYKHLQRMPDVKADDHVEGFVYEVNKDLGVFVAVDDKYYGMIPSHENFSNLRYGDRISARVARVREDGKLDLLLRDKLYQTANTDADRILDELKARGGSLPYADKGDADEIRNTFSMSKNQFKRALGYLYKKRLIEIDRDSDTVRLIIQF